MLSSVNTNSEYQFTQIDDNVTKFPKSAELLSRRVGKFDDEKKDLLDPLNKNKGKNKDNNNIDINQKEEEKATVSLEEKRKSVIEDRKEKLKEEEKLESNRELLEKAREPKVIEFLNEEEESSNIELNLNYPDGSFLSTLTHSFSSLATCAGAKNDKVTKAQLFDLLQNLSAKSAQNDGKYKKEVTFVKNLIAIFDTISEGKGYITSFVGVNDIQDYRTVTKEQVTPPIDLRI